MADESLASQIGTKLLYEDAYVRVWLLQLGAGEATEWHSHDCDYVFVVTRPEAVQTEYIDGKVEQQIGDALGFCQYRERDLGHRLANIGSSVYQNIVVELKSTREA